MTPLKQTILNDKETGALGNCMSACVAALLDKPIEEVPFFVRDKDWWACFQHYMFTQGYVCYAPNPKYYKDHSIIFYGWIDTFNGFHMAQGKTVRGTHHVVVYKNFEPYFDPHPSNDFLEEPYSYYLFRPVKEGDVDHYKHWKPQELTFEEINEELNQ